MKGEVKQETYTEASKLQSNVGEREGGRNYAVLEAHYQSVQSRRVSKEVDVTVIFYKAVYRHIFLMEGFYY